MVSIIYPCSEPMAGATIDDFSEWLSCQVMDKPGSDVQTCSKHAFVELAKTETAKNVLGRKAESIVHLFSSIHTSYDRA